MHLITIHLAIAQSRALWSLLIIATSWMPLHVLPNHHMDWYSFVADHAGLILMYM